MKYLIKVIQIGILLLVLAFLFIVIADRIVENSAKNRIFNSTQNIPHNKVGLLLGTSKRIADGRENLYYNYRINAAVDLYKAGKIDFILVSGDNSTKYYDEPTTIKKDLISKGVPAEKIFLDYAGFRTLDSIVRSKEIFGQDSITIISQQFHNERAIFIANRKDIYAVGFNAKDVGFNYGLKTNLRERLARVKMMLDLVFGKEPKFLGKQVEIK